MGMNKAADSTDATISPGSYTQPTANATSVQTVVPEAAPCSAMDVGESNTLPYPTETVPGTTRLRELFVTNKMEVVSVD
jgi:hypothetical protein